LPQLNQPGLSLSESEFKEDDNETEQPVAKLLKQVSMLEDERLALKEEVDTLRDQTIGPDPGQQVMQRGRQGRSTFFYVAAFLFTILAAFVGAFYGKNYL